MGMYDYVVLDTPVSCPRCGAGLTQFQSKDRACLLEQLHPWDVDRFYTSCSCGEWVEYVRKYPPPHRDWREDFDLEHPTPTSDGAS